MAAQRLRRHVALKHIHPERAEKPGSPGYQHTFPQMHIFTLNLIDLKAVPIGVENVESRVKSRKLNLLGYKPEIRAERIALVICFSEYLCSSKIYTTNFMRIATNLRYFYIFKHIRKVSSRHYQWVG